MKNRREFLKMAAGAALVTVAGSASAQENPFSFKKMEAGYEQNHVAEGKCGNKPMEGKCGNKPTEGKCGNKPAEGKCGAKP